MSGIKTIFAIYLEKGRGVDPKTGVITGPVKYFYLNGEYIAFWLDTSLSKVGSQEIGIKAGQRVEDDYHHAVEDTLAIDVEPLDTKKKKALKEWLGSFMNGSRPADYNVVSV